jgi:hypothetical protein
MEREEGESGYTVRRAGGPCCVGWGIYGNRHLHRTRDGDGYRVRASDLGVSESDQCVGGDLGRDLGREVGPEGAAQRQALFYMRQ